MRVKFFIEGTAFFLRKHLPEETFCPTGFFEIDEEDIKNAFGKGIKALRVARNLSLTEMEDALGIPNPSLSRYENGINVPSIIQAYKIAGYFETDVPSIIYCGLLQRN